MMLTDDVVIDGIDYQVEGMCGVPAIPHNPALFIDLPNHRRKRQAPSVSRFDFGAALGIAPAAISPAVASNTPVTIAKQMAEKWRNPNKNKKQEEKIEYDGEVHISGKIVGGNEAAPHSWPWTAHIVTGKIFFIYFARFCSRFCLVSLLLIPIFRVLQA